MSKEEKPTEAPKFTVPLGLPKPFGQRVLIKEIQQDEMKTEGGIIIPGAKQLQDCAIGIVMSKGSKVDAEIAIGDRVAFHKMANMAIYHKGVAYLHMADYELYCSYGDNTHFTPKVADTEELRREKRQEFTKNNKAISDEAIDKLDNESDMGKKKTTIIMPNKGVN